MTQSACGSDIVVRAAWARATPLGAVTAAVYATITNPTSRPIEILRITTEVAQKSELHESVEHDGMMRMRHIDPLIVSPGETLILQPGGKHIMLVKLLKPLLEGEKFVLKLTDKSAATTVTEVVVGTIGQMQMPGTP